MTPDWNKLGDLYKNSRATVIANIDCAGSGQSTCGKIGVNGYPTLKSKKKDSGDAFKGWQDFNGAREFSALKSFVEKNLAGPECSLEDKEGCEPQDLKILEESERMKPEERRAKIKEMQSELDEKNKQVKALQKEVKDITRGLTFWKAGGEKPDRVIQLTSEGEFREHCESRTCVIAFLPHILEGGAKERNANLKIVDAVFKHAKSENQPVGFMWSQGGDQYDVEEKLALQFGFPAMIAINLKKGKFGVHQGTWDKTKLIGFLSSMMMGRVPLQDIPKMLPPWSKADPWDGKDGEAPVEEEL